MGKITNSPATAAATSKSAFRKPSDIDWIWYDSKRDSEGMKYYFLNNSLCSCHHHTSRSYQKMYFSPDSFNKLCNFINFALYMNWCRSNKDIFQRVSKVLHSSFGVGCMIINKSQESVIINNEWECSNVGF